MNSELVELLLPGERGTAVRRPKARPALLKSRSQAFDMAGGAGR